MSIRKPLHSSFSITFHGYEKFNNYVTIFGDALGIIVNIDLYQIIEVEFDLLITDGAVFTV